MRINWHAPVRFSLFWRTFFLLAVLLGGSILAWLQTFRALELEPRAVQSARQIATLVNLSRATLTHTDAIARVSLIKTLADEEGVRIRPREPKDHVTPLSGGPLDQQLSDELRRILGPDTVVAGAVNGEVGFWLGVRMGQDTYWFLLDRNRVAPAGGSTWMVWLATAALLSLTGAALMAGLINRPLKQLSFAASRVRDGNFEASRLDEGAVTSEIREVNIGFNRMARQLAKIEQDRAIMLAGISHDLRTPLARLRLETELSVADTTARQHMAADIDQLDAIIDKFLDYARPDQLKAQCVVLKDVVDSCVFSAQHRGDLQVNVEVSEGLAVAGDEVELSRVLTNLLENARRYAKNPETGIATVDIAARAKGRQIQIKVRDHGPGVAPETLANLTRPFFRGDAARTAATGAGLGLAIVEKSVSRMGGTLSLVNASSGGLSAHITLHRV